MARDLNKLAAAARAKKEQERIERHEKLETDVTGLLEDILDSTFPVDANDNPDWAKFDWNKAEQLKQLLADFQAGRDPRRNRDDDRSQQDKTRRQAPAPAPAAPAAPDDEPEPANDTGKTEPQGRVKKVLRGFGARLNQ